jgi:hypothetical protein
MPKVRSVRTSVVQANSYTPKPSVRLHLLHGLLHALRAGRTAYLLERELALAAPQSLSHHGAHRRCRALTPLVSSCARYTNEKPPSPSSRTILTSGGAHECALTGAGALVLTSAAVDLDARGRRAEAAGDEVERVLRLELQAVDDAEPCFGHREREVEARGEKVWRRRHSFPEDDLVTRTLAHRMATY